MRGSTRRHLVIHRPAHEVWALVGRPELLHQWFPGIVACTVEGDHRQVTLDTGITMDERIVTNDPVLHRFQYSVSGPLLREHLATIDVLDLDDGTSMVVYSHDADPSTMALVLAGGSGAALVELARQLESRGGPAVEPDRHLEGGR